MSEPGQVISPGTQVSSETPSGKTSCLPSNLLTKAHQPRKFKFLKKVLQRKQLFTEVFGHSLKHSSSTLGS